MTDAPTIPLDVKREAYQLCQAIETLIYSYPERSWMAGLIATTAAFLGVVEEREGVNPLHMFAGLLKFLQDGPGIPEDDPVFRGHVMAEHETVQ